MDRFCAGDGNCCVEEIPAEPCADCPPGGTPATVQVAFDGVTIRGAQMLFTGNGDHCINQEDVTVTGSGTLGTYCLRQNPENPCEFMGYTTDLSFTVEAEGGKTWTINYVLIRLQIDAFNSGFAVVSVHVPYQLQELTGIGREGVIFSASANDGSTPCSLIAAGVANDYLVTDPFDDGFGGPWKLAHGGTVDIDMTAGCGDPLPLEIDCGGCTGGRSFNVAGSTPNCDGDYVLALVGACYWEGMGGPGDAVFAAYEIANGVEKLVTDCGNYVKLCGDTVWHPCGGVNTGTLTPN